jgi:hypothetical protein
MNRLHTFALAAVLTLPVAGVSCKSKHTAPLPVVSPAASTYSAMLARDWMDNAYLWVKDAAINPCEASRIYGYLGVTLWEAVANGVGDAESLAGILQGLDAMPEPAAGLVFAWDIVANTAIAEVARAFLSAYVNEIDALEDFHAAASDADSDVIARSRFYGLQVAAAIIAWADADGFADLLACNAAYTPPPVAGSWTGVGKGLHPCWGQQRTFVLVNAWEREPIGHPAFDTDPGSAFYSAALDVYNTTGVGGANLSADQLAIANYWADNPGATGTPPGHSVSMTTRALESKPAYDRLDFAAEAYARIGVAVADAFILCWRVKFETHLMRPNTYIIANIDPLWTSPVGTPNFPTYLSGHSTQSGAAAAVLTDLFGNMAFTDTTHSVLNPTLGFTDRSYASFFDACNEAKISRLYGGIHYGFDNQDGFDTGVNIGNLQNLRLSKVFGN